jgi:cyclopropane fatty-acyl-phospholipid synthase-like methyltransferase
LWIEGTDHFCSILKKGNQVLDVGCGAGVKSRYLSKKGLDVTGIDFSEKLIEIAKKESSGIEFIVMDMKDVRDLNRQFDGIFAQASLLHIPKNEIADVLGISVSALKSNGYIYVAVKGKYPDGPEEAVLKESDYGYDYERFFSYFTMDELKSYFNDLKLEIVYENHKVFGKTDWLQIIGKKKA